MEKVEAALELLKEATEDENIHVLDAMRIESAIYELEFLL